MHIRVDDTVLVIAGDDRGTRGRVLTVDHAAGKLVVEGVNRVKKHVRRSQRNPQGGRLSKEMPIQLANVLLVCQACGAATRTGARFLEDGSKVRYCKKCSAGIGQISPPKASRAKK
ncbi:MAG: 50S ribosomal protein L24 [Thermoguttaceae bacterium]|jgi:large subunit ribosomal protein L24